MFVKCLKINVVSHLECIPGILCSHRNSGYSLMASYLYTEPVYFGGGGGVTEEVAGLFVQGKDVLPSPLSTPT